MYLKLQKLPKYYDKDKKTHYVFWPVFVWDVLISSTKSRKLNILETSILGFYDVYCSRKLDLETISDLLDLDPDLIQYIVVQLHNCGWLKENKLTKDGKDILHNDSHEKEIAQLFQCGISGQWWDRVLPKSELEEWPVEANGNTPCFKRVKFNGQRESGRFDHGLRLNFDETCNEPLSNRVVHDVFLNYRRDFETALVTRLESNSIPSYVSSNYSRIQSHKPEKLYLFTMVEFVSNQGWCVRDPLNVAYYDPQLTQSFEDLLNKYDDLSREFPWEFNPGHNLKEYRDLSYFEIKKNITDKVKLALIQDYPLVDRIDGLPGHLSDWLSTKSLIDECGEEYDFKENKNFILESAALLELICKWVIENYPLSNVRCLPDGNVQKHIQRKTLTALVKQLGCLNAEQKNQVTKVDPKNLALAAKGKNSSLSALLLVIWVTCFENPSNPFTPILSNFTLFDRLYQLSNCRNALAHGQKMDDELKSLVTKTQSMIFFNDINLVLKLIFQEIKTHG